MGAHGMEVNDFKISSGKVGQATGMSVGLVGKFSMAGGTGATAAFCGNYGTDGKGVDFDFLHIPRAAAALTAPGGKLAGPAATTMTATAGGASVPVPGVGVATICTTGRPFRIRFVSDPFEVIATETIQTGFSLGYEQS